MSQTANNNKSPVARDQKKYPPGISMITYTNENRNDQHNLPRSEHSWVNAQIEAEKFEECGFMFSPYRSWSCWFDPEHNRYYEVNFQESQKKIELIRKYAQRVSRRKIAWYEKCYMPKKEKQNLSEDSGM